MDDDNVIVEGAAKFRDGKKWKSRWCLVRRLSPVADSAQLEVWRDARARAAGDACKAALALTQWVGVDSGFTLDKQSHTVALVSGGGAGVPVLALESRERLLQWTARIARALGAARTHSVLVARGSLRAGPARLLLRARTAALVAGAPPRILATFRLSHLRRYGVLDGRFCFEGGALCGAAAGLHVLLAERPHDITRDFDWAARDPPSPRRTPDPEAGERAPSRQEEPPASLPRCSSCMSKLGTMSRSSTSALTPGGRHFSPAWSMDALSEATGPLTLTLTRRPGPSRLGPYDDYDVPRIPSTVDGEYYDTPKRLKECLDLKITPLARSITIDALRVEPVSCHCPPEQPVTATVAVAAGEPVVVECEESVPAGCACRRVAEWAHGWVGASRGRPLYATVDVSRKPRRPLAAYENLEFARSLAHYENLRALARSRLTDGSSCAHCVAGRYVPMRPRARSPPGAMYATMAPRTAHSPAPGGRARSLSAEAPRGADGPGMVLTACSSLETLRAAPVAPGGSSGSNDSGVSSCSLRAAVTDCELPATSRSARRQYRSARRVAAGGRGGTRRSRSAPGEGGEIAEAIEGEVPLLRALREAARVAVGSSSSGTSDTSDYVETLSLCSSASSRGAGGAGGASACGCARGGRCVLRPRSGAEYGRPPPAAPH